MPTNQKLTYRIKGCDCDCATAPADPCQPCNGGTFEIGCRTRSGTAGLCGYEEYTSPSVPPKAYRKKNYSGAYALSSAGCPIDAGQYFTYTIGGYCLREVLGGTCGGQTDNSTFDQVASPSSGGNASGTLSCALSLSFTFGSTIAAQWVVTKTSRTIELLVSGCINAQTQITDHSAREFLTDEDTEELAMERANPEWTAWSTGLGGAGCCTSKSARGAGEFTFSFSEAEYRIRVAGAPGTLINIELTFTRTDGAPYTEIRQFVASGTTYPDANSGWQSFRISASPGKQTCLASARIYNP